MALTKKGTGYAIFFLILMVGGGAYYVYSGGAGAGSLSFSGVWDRFFGGEGAQAGGRLSDAEVRAGILDAILKNPELRAQGIDVEVNEKAITLKGNVETPIQRATLEQLAQGFSGSREVVITVGLKTATAAGSASSAADVDARLPKEVEFALYKTDAFDVKVLRITSQDRVVHLTGPVRSLAEKLLAERIAREVPEVRGVQNELQVP